MDEGWAVVLGAVIALTGSALVPWVRDALNARATHRRELQERIRAAVIDLLGANAAQAAAMIADDDGAFYTALESRGRAAAALLLELPADERRGIAATIALGSPGRSNGRVSALALQHALTAWASGDVSAADSEQVYRSEVARLKGGANAAPRAAP